MISVVWTFFGPPIANVELWSCSPLLSKVEFDKDWLGILLIYVFWTAPCMYNKVTNPPDESTFSKLTSDCSISSNLPLGTVPNPIWKLSSRNRFTPDSIQDRVQHGIIFAALLPIPAMVGEHTVAIAAIGDSADADATNDDRYEAAKTLLNIVKHL